MPGTACGFRRDPGLTLFEVHDMGMLGTACGFRRDPGLTLFEVHAMGHGWVVLGMGMLLNPENNVSADFTELRPGISS